MLNLHHLRLFRAVALDGTLTGAARRLNLSQSALSSQVRVLEAALGHDLFERRGRGLVLTEAGRIALEHAQAMGVAAVVLTSGATRRHLKALTAHAIPNLTVFSYHEVLPSVRIEPVGLAALV